MYPVSDSIRRLVRGSHARRARVTVLNSNLLPVPTGDISPDVVVSGKVNVIGGSGTRRVGEVSVSNPDGQYTPTDASALFYWNRLIRIEQGFVIVPGDESSVEWIPVATFMVDRPSVQTDEGGVTVLSVRGRDRWKMIDKAEYSSPGSYAAGTSVADVLASAAEFAGVSSGHIVTSSSSHTLGVALHYEEGDNVGELMTKLARSFAMRVYFDVRGFLIIEDEPLVTELPVAHHYREGDDSIVSKIKRDLTDERFANHIVVTSSSSDIDAPPPIRAVAEDTRPGSPTSISDIGRRTRRYASPMITSQAVADEVADVLLQRYLRFSEEVNVEAISLPFLDADDRVTLTHPNSGVNGATYRVESFDLPLIGGASSLRFMAAHDV